MFQPHVYQEDDYICKEGTQADEMFFLTKGKAGIYYGTKLIVVIEEGSYFGEIGCIMGGMASAVLEFMADNNYSAQIIRLGIPDRYLHHGTPAELYNECGFDVIGIIESVRKISQ